MRVPLRPRELFALIVLAAFGIASTGTHLVQRGESLSAIALRHGTTISELVAANRIADANRIYAGQNLVVPGTRNTAASTPGPASGTSASEHVVRPGESVERITRRHGITVKALIEANGIRNPNLIVIGSTLTIPGVSSAGGSSPAASGPSDGRQIPGERHEVRIGDTIGSIAKRYGIAVSDFVAWNGLVDGRIYATTRLVLYNPGSLPAAPGAGPTTHTVAAGQTLSGVASRFGVSVAAIVQASGISDPNRIRVGQQVTIPGGSAGFACPVPGGSFFNDWGFPRSGGRAHAGIDIFAPRGTPVRAPAAGFVEIATGSVGGHQFRLKMTDGTEWYGTHMDAFGATGNVRAGDVIGYVGDSGNARGSRPHLHFEVHPGGGAPVNPYPLLRDLC